MLGCPEGLSWSSSQRRDGGGARAKELGRVKQQSSGKLEGGQEAAGRPKEYGHVT